MRDALCRQRIEQGGSDLWFSPEPWDQMRAKQMCSACPVLETCWDLVSRDLEQPGIWAGTDVRQRRQMALRAGRRAS